MDSTEVRMQNLPGWSIESGKLTREFKFKNFNEAFAFMTSIALEAEKRDHHPDWSNVYDRVKIQLLTHSENRISQRDFDLAQFIQDLFSKEP